jgi:6-phosphogluconate dehydrogenase
MPKAQIGLIGLAVMGQNLALNMAQHGYRVAVYNRTTETMREFVAAHPGAPLTACERLEELVAALARPRRVLLMVKAGAAVDAVLDQLLPLLTPGDIVIDGGNSFFGDTERRAARVSTAGMLYVGLGVSGGEEGALHGPALMPGGPVEAWEQLRPLLQDIAAKVHDSPCVTYVGPRGAGHYVKMVHNGIEYADMQLIAETYDLLSRGLGFSATEIGDLFAAWNEGPLASYLVEITRDVLRRTDVEAGRPLVELILDEAQQKGTGKWTSQESLEVGAAVPTLTAAVEARIISAYKQERVAASKVIHGPQAVYRGSRRALARAAGEALYAAKLCSYAQGLALLRAASQEYSYGLNYGEIARIWRGGCIIRAALLEDIRAAYAGQPDLPNLLLAPAITQAVEGRQKALRHVLRAAIDLGIPMLGYGAALGYLDSYRAARLPANLIQAQRDYFGAHTYRRVDKEGSFHTEWGA